MYARLKQSLADVPDHRVRDWSKIIAIGYWKMMLCVGCPSAFAHAQAIEARIRFHSGMIWATLVGVVCTACGSLVTSMAWRSPLRALLVFSLVLALLLVPIYRRARSAEPVEVFLAYLCCLGSESPAAAARTHDSEDSS